MSNENKVIKLFTDGEVKTKDERKFTRLVGGFSNSKPMFTIWQASELLGQETREIMQNYERNIDNFQNDLDVKDLKSLITENDKTETIDITSFLKSIGINHNKYGRTKQWLVFSLSGMMKLVKIATTKESWNIYDSFLEDYFKTKAENVVMKKALNEELQFLKDEKAKIIGYLAMEENEEKRIELAIQMERFNDRITDVKVSLKTEKLEEALDGQSKLAESKHKYINQSDFGERFNRKLGAKTVGKLFQIVGLAKKTYKHRTTPYEQYIPKYAVNVVDNTIKNYDVAYAWSYNNCITFIDKWLKNNGKYEIFYSLTEKGQLIEYVNDLYDEIVLKTA